MRRRWGHDRVSRQSGIAYPADVAQAIVFYAGEDNTFMTGTTAVVNGGMFMY
ncbi:hypothetical protein ACWDSD_39670 [Streptomyces spiralis]|uniref:hypothetical protein n=1 Tax=Streptomyces sp. NRRL S-813 TaxID=1463919 RepID=UPI0019006B82|nr:hypothetical protein [Streptomyces sp. NRRL S-813]